LGTKLVNEEVHLPALTLLKVLSKLSIVYVAYLSGRMRITVFELRVLSRSRICCVWWLSLLKVS